MATKKTVKSTKAPRVKLERVVRRAHKKYTTMEVFGGIAEACKLLGWAISFDRTSKKVRYLLIGEPKTVDNLVTKLEIKRSAIMQAGHA